MLSPGFKSLGNFTITAAGTVAGDWVDGLDGLLSLCAQMRLAYGSGGTTVKAYLQTSLDQGTTPIDIACFTFTTASAVKARNLSALTAKTTDVTPSDAALTDDTSVDGFSAIGSGSRSSRSAPMPDRPSLAAEPWLGEFGVR
jgi:hypothetical protein